MRKQNNTNTKTNGKVNPLKPSERMKIPRHMPIEQGAEIRIANFNEVSQGFNYDLALEEAKRCLECKNPVCVEGCPVNIDIPGFIQLLLEKDYQAAYRKNS